MQKYAYILIVSSFALLQNSCQTGMPSLGGLGNINLLSSDKENQMGDQAYSQYKQKHTISTNSNYNNQLQRVASRITRVVDASSSQRLNWQYTVFADKSPNAFALPGGKIGVHTGIYQITRNDAGLAAVIGHEIAHVTKRHGGQSATRQMGVGVLNSVLAAKGVSSGIRTGIGMGADLGFVKPFSRSNELEADRLGMIYMAKAGYDPREAINVWKRMAVYKQQQGSNTPQFLSTHPVDSTRIAQLQRYLPEAMNVYNNRNSSNTTTYPSVQNSFRPASPSRYSNSRPHSYRAKQYRNY